MIWWRSLPCSPQMMIRDKSSTHGWHQCNQLKNCLNACWECVATSQHRDWQISTSTSTEPYRFPAQQQLGLRGKIWSYPQRVPLVMAPAPYGRCNRWWGSQSARKHSGMNTGSMPEAQNLCTPSGQMPRSGTSVSGVIIVATRQRTLGHNRDDREPQWEQKMSHLNATLIFRFFTCLSMRNGCASHFVHHMITRYLKM